LAKNKRAASELSKQFAAQTVQKYYIALIDLKPKKKQGMIKGDMKKARNGDWKLTTSQDNPAITHFFSFALKQNSFMNSSIASKSKSGGQQAHLLDPALRLCVVKPTSGKTPQIRVALKSLGTPIVGDKRYKGSQADRLYLHSYAIQFKYNEEFIQASCLPESGSLFSNISSHLAEIPTPWLMQWPTNKH
jgi:tRNA pseudouridine32 synthase/23S rRNA pseudouridine746 synthase